MSCGALINGLRTGCLVQVDDAELDDGRFFHQCLGQLGAYHSDRGEFTVTLLDGTCAQFKVDNIKIPNSLGKPGQGGDSRSFDVLVGPETSRQTLASEVCTCLFDKGFCVIRLIHSALALEDASACMRQLESQGQLMRLPEEVEEGYIGISNRGKVLWLIPEEEEVEDALLIESDAGFSSLASLIQKPMEDVLGVSIAERTPALISLSLSDEEEEEYPNPPATDGELGTFLGTWRRQLLKAFHFLGPRAALVSLEARRGSSQIPELPHLVRCLDLECEAGCVVIYRTDCFELACETPTSGTLMMTASYLKAAPEFTLEDIEGPIEVLTGKVVTAGPPPPLGDGLVNIMSIGCRLPHNWDEPEFLDPGLMEGVDAVKKIPLSKFDVDVFYTSNETLEPWQMTTMHTSVVEGAELFDNKMFDISNMEAAGMDPRQRHVLEVGAKLLDGIGISKKSSNRQVTNGGCSVGTDGYEWPLVPKDDLGAMGNSSVALAITANRFSFVFNMRGPNFFIDTACSASLYAAHVGKALLLEQRWDPMDFHVAIGTQLFILPTGFIGCSQAHMLSPDGRCFTFNASANGYLRGDGTSGICMKYGNFPKERHALLRGSNCNQDGRSASMTAPSGPAQEQCIWGAFREAKMSPPESTVWDCHGTGTSLGDPIELGAVRKIQVKQKRVEPLMLGTIKTNIGHLEGGAAMSGIVKCVLEVSHAHCAPNVHFRSLNAHLEHAAFEAVYMSELGSFPYAQGHCQVSSFGFGGSNGHAIFWGQSDTKPLDIKAAFRQRVAKASPPQVWPRGNNADDWDSDYPDVDAKPGDIWRLCFYEEEPHDAPLKWIKESSASVQKDDSDDAADGDSVFYCISGNFNGWDHHDHMLDGNVPGLFFTNIAIPSDGMLEFRFLKDGDTGQLIGPAMPKCTRKSTAIIGPSSDLDTSWVVQGEPYADVRIELYMSDQRRSVLWLIEKD